jgi:4-amino-4-deoxy-L-arabinose transferase-like glycosyltransferase
MLLYRPAEIPSLSWDEGWGLSVAKNWVQTGQYARLLQGNPVSAIGMSKPFSVTGPIAFSFFLFGVGIWQGRLTAMIFMALALFLFFHLARKLFNPLIAYLSLFGLLLLAIPSAHPWIIGREALAEAPMVFYLTVGYLFLLASLNGNKYAIFGTMIFWGLALDSKGHVFPFLTASVILPIIITYLRKQWNFLKLFCIAWAGSFPVYFLMVEIQKVLFSHYPIYVSTMKGLFTLVGFVITPTVRLVTLNNILLYGIPTIIGLFIGIKRIWKEFKSIEFFQSSFYIKLSLLGLVTSWFSWFAFLSIGWARYFFPISFMGSIFIALMLEEFIGQGKQLLLGTFKQAFFSRIKIYLLLIVIIYSISFNMYAMYYQIKNGDNYPTQVSEYVKQNITSNALIETYESELIFLLDNPTHYPPDQVQIELNRRTFLGQKIDILYNPSNIKFDYLIDGPNSKMWQLYTPLLEQGHFLLVYEAGDYKIYKRLP